MWPHLSLVECYRATSFTTSTSCTRHNPPSSSCAPPCTQVTHLSRECLPGPRCYLPRPAALEPENIWVLLVALTTQVPSPRSQGLNCMGMDVHFGSPEGLKGESDLGNTSQYLLEYSLAHSTEASCVPAPCWKTHSFLLFALLPAPSSPCSHSFPGFPPPSSSQPPTVCLEPELQE